MPKFSAYMRGEEGPQGDVGQAALIDGITTEQYINRIPLSSEKILAYYVRKNDGLLYLYISQPSHPGFVNQGRITTGFSTKQPTSVSTINWNQSASVSIYPNQNSETTGLESFLWNFYIPRGREAGFTTSPQLTEVQKLQSNDTPYVNIEDTNTPFYAKQFKFKFGIPVGVAAGFSTKIGVTTKTVSYTTPSEVKISVDPTTPETSKKFNFEFNIPEGWPAGFGVLSTSLKKLDHLEEPYFSVSTGGTNKAKNITFNLGIPAGHPGIISSVSATSHPVKWNESTSATIKTSGPQWDQKFDFSFNIPEGRPAGFSTNIGLSVSTLSFSSDAIVSITTDENSPDYSKKFDFYFGIPQGEPAGFGVLSTTIELLDHLQPPVFSISTGGTNMAKDIEFQLKIPQAHPARITSISTSTILKDYTHPAIVSATATGEDWEKHFQFDFQIPQGRPAGFSTDMGVSVLTLPSSSNATVTITPDETTPDYAKKFDFEFGIPHGEAADFGTPIISVESLSPHAEPTASIIASGGATTKVFDFHFGIPKGLKGDTGDALAVYEPISFTTGDPYWNGNSLHIQRGDENKKIPLFIFNNNKLNIAATFKVTEDEIIYDADEKFNGTIYLIAKSNKPTIKINSITTASYSYSMQHPEQLIVENIESTSSDLLLDFKIPTGPVGGTDDTGWQFFSDSEILQYRNIGKFVYIRSKNNILSPQIMAKSYATWNSIIPENYRPTVNTPLNCLITSFNSVNYSNRTIGCYIGTNGKITLFSGAEGVPSNLYLMVYGNYLID